MLELLRQIVKEPLEDLGEDTDAIFLAENEYLTLSGTKWVVSPFGRQALGIDPEYTAKPKVLSPNHWRYRIIHWVFGKENAPQAIYKSYCPLWHLSNAMALAAVFILGYRILFQATKTLIELATRFGVYLNHLFFKPAGVVLGNVRKTLSTALGTANAELAEVSRTTPGASSEPTISEEEITAGKAAESNKIFKALLSTPTSVWDDWDTIEIRHELKYLTWDEATAKVAEYKVKIITARARAELKKKRTRDRIYAIINFSQEALKAVMLMVWVLFGLTVIFCVVRFTPPVVVYLLESAATAIAWLLSTDYFRLFYLLGRFLIQAIVGIFALLLVLAFGRYVLWPILRDTTRAICPLLGSIAVSALNGGKRGCSNLFFGTLEFFQMVYKTHCPPIVLADESTEKLEAIANGAE